MFYLHETPCDRHIKHSLGGSSATSQFLRFVNTPTFGTDQSSAAAGGGVTGWGILLPSESCFLFLHQHPHSVHVWNEQGSYLLETHHWARGDTARERQYGRGEGRERGRGSVWECSCPRGLHTNRPRLVCHRPHVYFQQWAALIQPTMSSILQTRAEHTETFEWSPETPLFFHPSAVLWSFSSTRW